MQSTDPRDEMRIEFDPRTSCIPAYEFARLQKGLAPLSAAVRGIPAVELQISVRQNRTTQAYRVEARLSLPGQTYITSSRDPHLYMAFQRCIRNLAHGVRGYRQNRLIQLLLAAGRRAGVVRESLAVGAG